MKTFLIVLFCVGVVSTITYAGLALGYRHKIVGYAKTKFDTFLYMYKIAPDKWEYNSYYYRLYYSQGNKSIVVYMASFFDNIQLYLWCLANKRESEKETADKRTKELYDFFAMDAFGEANEHTDT